MKEPTNPPPASEAEPKAALAHQSSAISFTLHVTNSGTVRRHAASPSLTPAHAAAPATHSCARDATRDS